MLRCNTNSYTGMHAYTLSTLNWEGLGISFSLQEWLRLRSLYSEYCFVRNSHWDDGWHKLMNGPEPILPSTVLASKTPRAIHAGRCGGIHFRGKNCDVDKEAEVSPACTPWIISVWKENSANACLRTLKSGSNHSRDKLLWVMLEASFLELSSNRQVTGRQP